MSAPAGDRADPAGPRILDGLRIRHRDHRRALVTAGIASGIAAAARVMLIFAIAYLARNALWSWLRLGAPAGSPVAAALGMAGLAIAVILLCWIRAQSAPLPLRRVAERLDEVAGTKNRLSNALAFLGCEAGPFMALAIEDGARCLEELPRALPIAVAARKPGAREASLALAAGLILLLASWIPVAHPAPQEARHDTVREEARAPSPIAGTEESAPGPKPPAAIAAPRRENPPDPTRASTAGMKSGAKGHGRQESGKEQRATGKPSPGMDIGTRDAQQGGSAEGQATEGLTAATPESENAKRPSRKSKEADPTKTVRPSVERKDDSGATAGQAGAGGGAMSPTRSAWAQRDQSGDDPLPENPADENMSDEAEAEDARGGTQPSLKDRRGSTSRDLSISGPGEGGDGRGGPSPQKKARGTASLVLGVPVPDFVRGLLNPGTTKVTYERVEPVSQDSAPDPILDPRPRSRPEAPQPRMRVDPALRDIIKKFLIDSKNREIANPK